MYLILVSIFSICVCVLYGVDAKTNHPYLAAIGVSAAISFFGFLFFLVGKSSEYLIWSLFFVGIPWIVSSVISMIIIALIKWARTQKQRGD